MALLAYGKSNQNHADGGGNKPLLAEKRTSPTDQYNFSSSSVTASTKKNGNVLSGNKPLPLKQRTSSSSNQRDFNQKTWLSLLVLVKFREFFVTVDHFSIWRRHLAWANDDGKDLRTYMTQRYASNMVFMSLLLSTELGVLFNSAHVTTEVRQNLVNSQHGTISFWAGLLIIISALFTILSLISTFTAWAMVSSIDEANAHCVLRSSIGQYAAELPGRFIVCSIYSFLISFMLFFFLLLPIGFWSILLLVCTSGLFFHVVSVFSGFGRIIMHSGAMSKQRIFSPEYEEFLVPESLHSNLLKKAKCNLVHNTSIIRQYRRRQQPIDRSLEPEQLWDHLNGKPNRNHFGYGGFEQSEPPMASRSRADSIVRFADEEQGLKSYAGGSNLPGTRLVRAGSTGGNLKQISYIGQHHQTATPLSVLSEGSHRSTFSDMSGDFGIPRSSLLQKDRVSRPPTGPSKDVNSVQNVSTASLEEWLQGASPEKDPFSSNTKMAPNASETDRNSDRCSSQMASSLSFEEHLPLFNFNALPHEVATKKGFCNYTDNALHTDRNSDRCSSQMASSPSFEEHLPLFNFNALPHEVATKKSFCNYTDNAYQQTELDPIHYPSQPMTSSEAQSDKELSEGERFAMDYGDFDIEEDDQNRMKPKELKQLSRLGQRQANPWSTNTDDELSNLLGSGSDTNTPYTGDRP